MNITDLAGIRYQKRSELKQLFLLLTDSDLLLLENKQDEMLNRLHKKPFRAKEDKHNRVGVA